MSDESLAALGRAAAGGDLAAARRLVAELERLGGEEPRYWFLTSSRLRNSTEATVTCPAAATDRQRRGPRWNTWAAPLRTLDDAVRGISDEFKKPSVRYGGFTAMILDVASRRLNYFIPTPGIDAEPAKEVRLEPGWSGLCTKCAEPATDRWHESPADCPPDLCRDHALVRVPSIEEARSAWRDAGAAGRAWREAQDAWQEMRSGFGGGIDAG